MPHQEESHPGNQWHPNGSRNQQHNVHPVGKHGGGHVMGVLVVKPTMLGMIVGWSHPIRCVTHCMLLVLGFSPPMLVIPMT
jgi:hypothetical protein